MEPMKNHYLEIPEERKLRIFREEDERFYSFWEKMLDDKQSFYQQPLKRMKGDAWHSLHSTHSSLLQNMDNIRPRQLI